MSVYSNALIDSDLDAFKNSGSILSTSIVISGSLAGGEMKTFSASPLTLASVDMQQILFDNSAKHSGKFKDISLESGYTLVFETTNLSELSVFMNIIISSNTVQITATMFNPYAGSINLQSTTLNFRYIPYEATF